MHIRRGAIACLLSALAVFSSAVHPRAADQAPQAKPAAEAKASAEQQDLSALTAVIDAVASGKQAAPADVRVAWVTNDFIRSTGDSVYIPFTLNIDRGAMSASTAALYVRVVNKAAAATSAITLPGGRPTYPWDTIHFIDVPVDGNVARAIALTPGSYEAFIGVKEKGTPAPGKIGVVRHEITVPALGGADLNTSSVILARGLEQLSAPLATDKQQDNPYVFGTLKLTPSLDHVFAKSGKLQVLFWIYGASQTNGKPDVTVEFNFHQRMPDGSQKYFNKTQPQEMNEKTLPQEFNLTAGHQLLSSLEIPLSSFPAGDYRLEIKVTDKPSGKSLTRDVNFQVSAS
jgi:hypothetical protein